MIDVDEQSKGSSRELSQAVSGVRDGNVWELQFAGSGMMGRAPFTTKRRAMHAYRLLSQAMAAFDRYGNDQSKTVSFATAIGMTTVAVRSIEAVSVVEVFGTTERQPSPREEPLPNREVKKP